MFPSTSFTSFFLSFSCQSLTQNASLLHCVLLLIYTLHCFFLLSFLHLGVTHCVIHILTIPPSHHLLFVTAVHFVFLTEAKVWQTLTYKHTFLNMCSSLNFLKRTKGSYLKVTDEHSILKCFRLIVYYPKPKPEVGVVTF